LQESIPAFPNGYSGSSDFPARIDQMPAIPKPLKIIDWKKKTLQFDSLVFNFNSTASYGPLIWLDSSRRNMDQVTFGLYTVIGDVRQGPKKNNGEFMKHLRR